MSVQAINSAAAQTINPPAQDEYVVQQGDTLGSIARDRGIDLGVLQQANPQVLNPDVVYPGQTLTIPSPPQASVDSGSGVKLEVGLAPGKWAEARDALTGTTPPQPSPGTATKTSNDPKIGFGPDGVSGSHTRKTEQTTTGSDGSSSKTGSSTTIGGGYDPDKGTVTVSAGGGFSQGVKNAKGYGVSFGVDGKTTVTGGLQTKNGVTTYSASTDVSVTLKVGVTTPKAGAEYATTNGIKSSFEVRMPEAAAKTADIGKVNPFDPATMPTGTVVKLDGSTYSGTDFKLTFKELAVQTKVTDENGSSLLVEKTGDDKVRVTAGPTAAIAAYNGVGIDLKVASAMLGRDDKLSSATLKTAEFDLATPEGKAAYNDFLVSGKFPEKNGNGVGGVATIEKLDYSSQSKLDAKLGPIGVTLNGAKNTGSSVLTTYPDGTSSRVANLQYSGNVPMAINQTFDANGKEILADRTYSYTIKTDANSAQLINVAQTGDIGKAGSGPVKAGQTVTLTYTESQMRELMTQTQNAVKANEFGGNGLKVLTQDYDGKFVNSPQDFAIGLARNLGGSDYGSAERLFNISAAADGDLRNGYVKLPGTVTVH